MNKVFRIMRMEFRLTVMSRLFIAFTVIGPFFFALIAVMPTALASSGAFRGAESVRVAVVAADGYSIDAIAEPLRARGITVISVERSAADSYAGLESGAFDGYVIIPADDLSPKPIEFIMRGYSNFRVMADLEGVIGSAMVARRFRAAGIPDARMATIALRPSFETWRVGKDGRKERILDFPAVLTTGLFFSVSLYMTLILYGQIIGRSVLMEKTSMTIEIILSSVRPLELMFGKIFGKAIASLLQLGVWIGISKCILKFVGRRFGYSTGIALAAGDTLSLVLFFVLAYFLYCSVYAALGAASQDEQHLGQLSWPVIAVLIIPIMLLKPIILSPNSVLVVALSLFPLTAPIVMFLRILLGDAPLWEIGLSAALMLGTTAAVIWISAKILSAGIFMAGKRLSYRGILALLRNR